MGNRSRLDGRDGRWMCVRPHNILFWRPCLPIPGTAYREWTRSSLIGQLVLKASKCTLHGSKNVPEYPERNFGPVLWPRGSFWLRDDRDEGGIDVCLAIAPISSDNLARVWQCLRSWRMCGWIHCQLTRWQNCHQVRMFSFYWLRPGPI